MNRGLTLLKRGALVLTIWMLALLQLVQVGVGIAHYISLKREVHALNAQYQSKLEDYTGLLAEGDKIRHDPQYQVSLLKRNYGYTEPDETPIIVRVGE